MIGPVTLTVVVGGDELGEGQTARLDGGTLHLAFDVTPETAGWCLIGAVRVLLDDDQDDDPEPVHPAGLRAVRS